MSDRDDVRGLAEGIGAELAHRLGVDAPPCEDTEMVESMIRAFLAEREVVPRAAHVIEKIRHGGERHGERVFYVVGPARGSLAEAHDDEAKIVETAVSRREEILEGQLAALRSAANEVAKLHEYDFRREDIRAILEEKVSALRVALATDAGRLEAEVLRAAVERRKCYLRSLDLGDGESLEKALADQALQDAQAREALAVDALQAAKETP